MIIGNFWQKQVIFNSEKNQLTSADFGQEFSILTKTKYVGNVAHLILALEFNSSYQKYSE